MDNLFEMFGVDVTPVTAKTSESKKGAKKTGTRKTAKSSAKKEMYEFPVNIISGYREAFSFMPVGVKKADFKELKKLISENFRLPEELVCIQISEDKKTVYISLDSAKGQTKGDLKVSPDDELILPNGEILCKMSEFMEDISDSSVNIEHMSEELKNIAGIEYSYNTSFISKDGKVFLAFDGEEMTDSKLDFPFSISIPGYRTFEITEEEYAVFTEKKSFDKETLKAYVASKVPTIADHFILQYDNTSNVIRVKIVVVEKGAKAPVNKKTLFPTTYSLYIMGSTPIQLSPDMFGGKEVVEEKEIISYVHDNISVIFKEGRCSAELFKEDSAIYITMKGSKKGAITVFADEAQAKKESQKPFAMFQYKDREGHLWNVEKNPVIMSRVNLETGEGKFALCIPKIPGKIFDQICAFFDAVAHIFHTEVMVRIFWNAENQEYEVALPVQTASPSTVTTEDYSLGTGSRFLVSEFHSHCKYRAFFSSTDDTDEIMACAYGVFGNFLTKDPYDIMHDMRSCAIGKHYSICREDVFTEERATQKEIDTFVESFLGLADKKVNFIKY